MNLNTFRNTFAEGFQQNNRFSFHLSFGANGLEQKLRLSGSPGLSKGLITLQDGLACEATRLPDRAFDMVQMTQYALTEQFPYKTDFTTLDCTFLLPLQNNRNVIAEVFSTWQNIIHNFSQGFLSSRDFEWPDNYYATGRLYTYDRQSHTTGCYVFERMYPKTVDAVNVTWSDNSEVAKLGVTFAFSTWRFTLEDAPLDEGDRIPEPNFAIRSFDDGIKHGTNWLELTLGNLLGAAEGWARNQVWHWVGSSGENHKPEPNFTPQTFATTRRTVTAEPNFLAVTFDDREDHSVPAEPNIIQ